MDTNDSKKPIQTIRNEIKYIVFIVLFVAGIVFNYLAISSKVDANTYRITKIEDARAIAWNQYYSSCEKQLECSQEMREDIIKIKVKLGIEN